MRITLLFLATCLLVSCHNEKPTSGAETAKSGATAAKDLSTSGVSKLYEHYYDNPDTQAKKDQNDLIDYAVDKGLDVIRTQSGLYYIVLKEGNGQPYVMGQPCKAHYKGYTMDGKIFDSSYNRNQPLIFNVGQMIPGWNEALQLMNAGTTAKLLIPSRLAYGERGFPGFVAPNTPLIFDLELLPLAG